MAKKFVLVQIFELIKAGRNPAQISKELNIPKTTIAYSVGKLKKMGCIEKKGYGVWEAIQEPKKYEKVHKVGMTGTPKKVRTSPKKQIRGHAFKWRIRFFKDINWEKRIKESKLKYQMICMNKVFRIIYKGRKIWLTKNGMVIYEPLDFMGKSSYESKGKAVYEMDRLIKSLLNRLRQNFVPYQFTTSTEHYAIIKNELARQYNDRKEKLLINNEEGTTWLWIDDSKGLSELETNDPKINREVQNWWNDNKKHNFQVTPTFLMETMNQQSNMIGQNAMNLNNYSVHLKAHVDSVKQLGASVQELTKLIKEMKDGNPNKHKD